jgi:XTP/dITP diphosphohydrolase
LTKLNGDTLRPKLLLATNNPGKVREFQTLLGGIPFELVTLTEAKITTVIEETGTTYEDNARLKASALAEESGLLTLADDSGLEVDALDGAPGTLSARYAGENASDSDRVNYLLSRIKDIPREKRTAHFRCVIALAKPGGWVELCHGECSGIITFEPRGAYGFGYDPIFYFPELGKTMAELSMEVKNRVSHRGRAAEKARQVLQKLADTEQR